MEMIQSCNKQQNIAKYCTQEWKSRPWSSTNAIHVVDCGSKQLEKSAGEPGRTSGPKTSDSTFYKRTETNDGDSRSMLISVPDVRENAGGDIPLSCDLPWLESPGIKASSAWPHLGNSYRTKCYTDHPNCRPCDDDDDGRLFPLRSKIPGFLSSVTSWLSSTE